MRPVSVHEQVLGANGAAVSGEVLTEGQEALLVHVAALAAVDPPTRRQVEQMDLGDVAGLVDYKGRDWQLAVEPTKMMGVVRVTFVKI